MVQKNPPSTATHATTGTQKAVEDPPTIDAPIAAAIGPGDFPDYFGTTPNFANSPLPTVVGGVVTSGGMRKFIDSLPGLGIANQSTLHNYLPVATPDTITYPGCDYYEIAVRQYTQQLHRDLPATPLRGYIQVNNGTDLNGHNTILPPATPFYLGPVIKARRNRPVRVKFVNQLPIGLAGHLFLPVDPSLMGAGTGPLSPTEQYTQNRADMHLHGGFTQWISDGTPYQWITPAGETTLYPRGVSATNVPDMTDPGAGALTLYYPNQQSNRMMWIHDHSIGITRLNVYAGMAQAYLLSDPVEEQMIADHVLPAEEIALVIQDKTFVPGPGQLATQDPTWDTTTWGGRGSLWFPHVYMPNQNPYKEDGANPMGRWDYGPWFWPPFTGIEHGPVPNPYFGQPGEPPVAPGTPTPTSVPEAFMDTPLVNGAAYPYLVVEPKAYRFRILNACNDRYLNLQLYHAASNAPMWSNSGQLLDANSGEVPMVEACPDPAFPPSWPTDGRAGGVPDPTAVGPDWLQIGNEGGFLPDLAVIHNQPINYVYNRRDITVLNVSDKTVFLGPAERADVVIDFSSVAPGQKIILYNDAPAPVPAFDPRYDYYTGDPDQTSSGGAPSTQPGYGPNTRTLMQFQVQGTPAAPVNIATLRTRLRQAYGQTQGPPIVPEIAYDPAFGTVTSKNTYVPIQANTITFTPFNGSTPVTLPLGPKAIQEDFDTSYGRMDSVLGTELPNTSATIQTTIMLHYQDPPTEILSPSNLNTLVGSAHDGTQLWKVTHNGVDTHVIHFHLFNVQLINRVGWDGAIRPPDANELGWKETVRMNPLEDCIVAMRPSTPTLPFKVGDSVRMLDPSQVPGSSAGFTQIDPTTGQPAVVTNVRYNFGWEYVWHCHLLGHEENDMMRPIQFNVSPAAPSGLTVTPSSSPAGLTLRWTNNATLPAATNILIQRATNALFTTGVTTFTVAGSASSYSDTTVTAGVLYYYRVRAENSVSYSAWSNTASGTVPLAAPSNLTATVSTSPPLTVTVAWRNNSVATTIDIQRATNSSFTSNLRTFTVGYVASYVDNTVAAGTTYYYRVRANTPSGSSAWSPTAMVTTPTIPAAPTNLAGTAIPTPGEDTAIVNLSWVEPAGNVVGGFTIQRATNSTFTSGLATMTAGASARTFSDTGRARNTRYYYRIQAFNGAGTSAFSGSISVLTPV